MINNWLLENKELISVYTSIFGAIAIPLVLFLLVKSSEKKKEDRENARIERDKQEQIRKDEKEYLIRYIEKYLYSSYDDYFNFKNVQTFENIIEDMKIVLDTKLKKLNPLNVIVHQLSYNYLHDFFYIFTEIVTQTIDYKWKNQKDFVEFYQHILESMPMLVFLILTEKEQYKRMKSSFFNNFLNASSDEARNIVSSALEKYKKNEEMIKELYNKMTGDQKC